MEVNVKVTVDLGDKTVALINGAFAPKTVAVEAPKALVPATSPESAPKPTPEAPKVSAPQAEAPAQEIPAPTRTRRTKEQIAAEEAATANSWDSMDEDDKLEAIKAEVTKHAKKGKSADIKFMLSQFEAGRASELSPEDYSAFFEAITRYGKGEELDVIFPGLD